MMATMTTTSTFPRSSSNGLLAWSIQASSGPTAGAIWCEVRSTCASRGDFRNLETDDQGYRELDARRRSIVDAPWTWVRQVHGNWVVEVGEPGEHAGETADGAWTSALGAPLAVTTADCAPVVLVAEEAVAVVHAGWRGLEAGIIERAGRHLRASGAEPVAAILAPCIGPERYAFGREDLARLAAIYGPSVAAETTDGQPALDMTAAVAAACERAGWVPPARPPSTSGDEFFSHRTRVDRGRQATVAWLRRVS